MASHKSLSTNFFSIFSSYFILLSYFGSRCTTATNDIFINSIMTGNERQGSRENPKNPKNVLDSSRSASLPFPKPWSDLSPHLLMPLQPTVALNGKTTAPMMPGLYSTPVKMSKLKPKPPTTFAAPYPKRGFSNVSMFGGLWAAGAKILVKIGCQICNK